jgi:hypothetical protein
MDLNLFIKLAQYKNIAINNTPDTKKEFSLMRLLMSYSLLYSIGHSFNEQIENFSLCSCPELGPYCNDSNEVTFKINILQKLKESLLIQKSKIDLTELKKSIVEAENKVVETCEETCE